LSGFLFNKSDQNRPQSDQNRHIATAAHMSGRLGLRRCGMKLSKSLEEGICPPTRQGDRVQPATEVLYHRRVAMSSKNWLELLGCGDSRLAGVRGRSAEEPIRQFGGTGSFRRVFSGADLGPVFYSAISKPDPKREE